MISAKQPQPLPDKVQGAQVKAKDLALQLPNGSLKVEDVGVKDGRSLLPRKNIILHPPLDHNWHSN